MQIKILTNKSNVLSVSIDGQSLEDAIKQGVTSAVISTGSSYLASQIGLAKPEIGELNHKLLHGLYMVFQGDLFHLILELKKEFSFKNKNYFKFYTYRLRTIRMVLRVF